VECRLDFVHPAIAVDEECGRRRRDTAWARQMSMDRLSTDPGIFPEGDSGIRQKVTGKPSDTPVHTSSLFLTYGFFDVDQRTTSS
jgi:hypothetical protein